MRNIGQKHGAGAYSPVVLLFIVLSEFGYETLHATQEHYDPTSIQIL
jgi:hypothetical protein